MRSAPALDLKLGSPTFVMGFLQLKSISTIGAKAQLHPVAPTSRPTDHAQSFRLLFFICCSHLKLSAKEGSGISHAVSPLSRLRDNKGESLLFLHNTLGILDFQGISGAVRNPPGLYF